jgi:superoxide oxidase
MSPRRYEPVTQSLHWLVAIAIVATYALALWREALPKGDFRTAILNLHMSLGLAVIGLTVLRIGWRSVMPAPAPVASSRMAMLAAKGRTVGFFGIVTLPSPLVPDRAFGKLLEEVHKVAAHLMMILAGLHAAAAIGHQLILKDGTLSRMVPFGGALRERA